MGEKKTNIKIFQRSKNFSKNQTTSNPFLMKIGSNAPLGKGNTFESFMQKYQLYIFGINTIVGFSLFRVCRVINTQ